jgi:hypothetical protein
MTTIKIEETFNDHLKKHLLFAVNYFQSQEDIKLIATIADRNEEWLKKNANDYKGHNIYAYYIKIGSFWELFYLGQTHSKYSIQRMRQHLIKASKTTSSKLKDFKNIDELGFKSITIDPQELRHYFETMLIQELRKNHKYLSNNLLK